jgi:hypothetical protein
MLIIIRGAGSHAEGFQFIERGAGQYRVVDSYRGYATWSAGNPREQIILTPLFGDVADLPLPTS